MPCRADFISNKTYSTSHSFTTCHSKYRALCIRELDEVCIDWPCAQCMMSRSTSTCTAFTPSFHAPQRRPHFHQQTSTSSRSCSQPRLKRCGSIHSPNYLPGTHAVTEHALWRINARICCPRAYADNLFKVMFKSFQLISVANRHHHVRGCQ